MVYLFLSGKCSFEVIEDFIKKLPAGSSFKVVYETKEDIDYLLDNSEIIRKSRLTFESEETYSKRLEKMISRMAQKAINKKKEEGGEMRDFLHIDFTSFFTWQKARWENWQLYVDFDVIRDYRSAFSPPTINIYRCVEIVQTLASSQGLETTRSTSESMIRIRLRDDEYEATERENRRLAEIKERQRDAIDFQYRREDR